MANNYQKITHHYFLLDLNKVNYIFRKIKTMKKLLLSVMLALNFLILLSKGTSGSVLFVHADNSGSKLIEFSFDALPGIYFLDIKSGERTSRHKIIMQ